MTDPRAAQEKASQLRKTLAAIDRLTGGGSERSRDAKRKRESRAETRNIQIPPCADRARRERLEADDVAWLMYYFGPESGVRDPFWYAFTSQQLEMIELIDNAINYRDDQALAASRGEGKTTIVERKVIKETLRGILSFAVLFAATGALADNSLDTIKGALEENPLLLADYPEVCVPIVALENIPSRAHYQTVSGRRHDNGEPYDLVPSRFGWSGQEITLPNVPGSPAARAIVATRGLDSAVRGIKRKGRRPQLAVVDDADTEETATSEFQSTKLEKRIDRSIGGLGDQQNPIGRVMLCTLQSRISAAYRFTDPVLKPTWKGKRYRYLVKPPLRVEMWDDYMQQRSDDYRAFASGKSNDKYCRRAHQFYLDNRAAMEEGAVVANPHRFNPKQLPDGSQVEASALQAYYNHIVRIGAEAVATEYDNDPPQEDGIERLVLTAYHIQNNCLSGLEKRIIPDGTASLTIGADIQKLGMHFVTLASDERAVGSIVDYDFFEFLTEGRAAADCELAILEGLFRWYEAQEKYAYVTQAGEEVLADLTLIDMGWKEESWNIQPVQVFCQQVGFEHFMPSKGIPNYRRPKDSGRIAISDNWHIGWPGGVPIVEMNSDHWKLKVHEGFLAARGEPGSLTIFEPQRVDGRRNRLAHLSYSKHILSETWETRAMPGFKGSRTGWWKSAKPNHYFDATYQAIVARSMRGISALGGPSLPTSPAVQASAEPGEGYGRSRGW